MRVLLLAILFASMPLSGRSGSMTVDWWIATTGTGPGVVEKTASTEYRLTSVGACSTCAKYTPIMPNCVHWAGSVQALLEGLALVPEGEVNVWAVFSGGPSFYSSGNWYWVVSQNQYIHGGGELESGSSPSGSMSARVGYEGGFVLMDVGTQVIQGMSQYCAPPPGEGCGMGGWCGMGSDMFSMSIRYLANSSHAPKMCTQGGVAGLEADAAWHTVASASCMATPDVAASYSGKAHKSAKDELERVVESRMVADPNDPGSLEGPVLIARAGCPVLDELQPPVALRVWGEVTEYYPDKPRAPMPGVGVVATRALSGVRVTAVSDATGIFFISVPQDGVYTVTASPLGYEPLTHSVTASATPSCQGRVKCAFRAPCSAPVPPGMSRLRGTVTLGTTGKAVKGAEVTALNADGGAVSVLTDGLGRYQLLVPSGNTYSVKATFGAMESDPVTASLGEATCEFVVDLVLECRACSHPVPFRYQCHSPWCCRNLDCVDQDSCDCGTVNCTHPVHASCPQSQCGSRTFCAAGCLLMCVAMVADRDPVRLNRDLTDAGVMGPAGDLSLGATGDFLGWDSVTSQSYDPGVLLQELCDPGLAIIADVGEHFIVVTSHELDSVGACRFRVADPGTIKGQDRYLDQYAVVNLRVICLSECIDF